MKPNGSWKLLLIAYAAFVLFSMPAGALNVAWLSVQHEFELPLSALGLLLTAMAVGRLIISFYIGQILKRITVGTVLLLAGMLNATGYVGFALAPSWPWFIVAGAVVGVGGAFLANGLILFVAANYSASRMSWLHASFGVGVTIGPFLMTTIMVDWTLSWRVGYLVMAIGVALMAVLFFVTRPEWAMGPSSKQNAQDTPRMLTTLRLPIVWLIMLMLFVSAGVEVSTGQLTNSLFVSGHNLDPKMVGTWISLYWMGLTIGRIISGTISDRVDHGLLMRLSILGAITGAVLITTNVTPIISAAGLILMGFALGPLAPTLYSDTVKRVGTKHAPATIGFQNVGGGLGLSAAPAIGGVLAEAIGLEAIGPYLIVLAFTCLLIHELILGWERQQKLVPKPV